MFRFGKRSINGVENDLVLFFSFIITNVDSKHYLPAMKARNMEESLCLGASFETVPISLPI